MAKLPYLSILYVYWRRIRDIARCYQRRQGCNSINIMSYTDPQKEITLPSGSEDTFTATIGPAPCEFSICEFSLTLT